MSVRHLQRQADFFCGRAPAFFLWRFHNAKSGFKRSGKVLSLLLAMAALFELEEIVLAKDDMGVLGKGQIAPCL